MTQSEYAVEMKGISKTFPGVKALDKVDFRVKPGEIHGLVGENGAGKSTLLKILMGALEKDAESGPIFLNGNKVTIKNPIEAENYGLAAVYQHMMLAPELPVAENIFLGNQPSKTAGVVNWNYMYTVTEDLLSDLDVTGVNPKEPLRELSNVEKKMVAIAKALKQDANILILDEPTAILSEEETEKLHDTILDLKDQDVSVIYVNHRLDEVRKVCDRVTILRNGKRVGVREVATLTEDEMISLMVGEDIGELYYKEDLEKGEPLLEVKNLKSGDRVKEASFTLHERETFGIYGLVGAGRTELLRVLFGADPADSGKIKAQGKRATIEHPNDAIKKDMGLVPEDRHNEGLALPLNVRENCNLVSSRESSTLGVLNKSREKDVTARNIKDLNIKTPSQEQKLSQLSGGNQQKVVIAKWLNIEANILLFDEATVGIDIGAKKEIYELMARLLKEDKGIIFVSSYLDELMGVCDRIGVISNGRMTGIVDAKDTSQEELLRLATKQIQQ